MKTEKIAAALRCSSQVPGPQLDCRTCSYHVEETVDGVDYAGCDCDRIAVDAADRLEELVDRCARYAEEIAVLRERGKRAVEDVGLTAEEVAALQKDWSDLCTVVGECGGLDRIKELAKADKDGRMAILPCEPGGVMLDMSDLERPEMMKRLHFAVAYVRCGIVFHQPYKIFSENVAAGHIRPVSGLAGKMLGEEDWP